MALFVGKAEVEVSVDGTLTLPEGWASGWDGLFAHLGPDGIEVCDRRLAEIVAATPWAETMARVDRPDGTLGFPAEMLEAARISGTAEVVGHGKWIAVRPLPRPALRP